MPTSRPILALVCSAFADVYSRESHLPALERLVSYGGGLLRSTAASELNPWQGELLHALQLGDARQYPSAPVTWLGMNEARSRDDSAVVSPDNSTAGTWLHAEPVIQSISAHGLSMNRCGPWSSATLAEVTALVKDHLEILNMRWHVVGSHSFLQTMQALDVHTLSASQAIGGELQEALPTGRDATVLRRAMTELQMLLHEKLTGRSAPNAIWLWGAGQMPQLPLKDLPAMWTNDDYTRGVYRVHAADGRCSSLESGTASVQLDAMLERAEAPQLLAVIRDCSLETLETQWFAPALQALNRGQVQAVSVYLDGWQLHARRSFVRRLFAKPRSLTEWMN